MVTWSLGAVAAGGPRRPRCHRTAMEDGAEPEPGSPTDCKARSRLRPGDGRPRCCGVRGSPCHCAGAKVIRGFPPFFQVFRVQNHGERGSQAALWPSWPSHRQASQESLHWALLALRESQERVIPHEGPACGEDPSGVGPGGARGAQATCVARRDPERSRPPHLDASPPRHLPSRVLCTETRPSGTGAQPLWDWGGGASGTLGLHGQVQRPCARGGVSEGGRSGLRPQRRHPLGRVQGSRAEAKDGLLGHPGAPAAHRFRRRLQPGPRPSQRPGSPGWTHCPEGEAGHTGDPAPRAEQWVCSHEETHESNFLEPTLMKQRRKIT